MPEKTDALEGRAGLRAASARLRDDWAATPVRRRAAPLHRLLLALEMRWILEEQVVIPALGTRGSAELLRAAERESALLRDASRVARAAALNADAQLALAGALEGLAALRSERIEQALLQAQRSERIDSVALRREMDRWLERWHAEVQASGDIEDEDVDPVGQAPR